MFYLVLTVENPSSFLQGGMFAREPIPYIISSLLCPLMSCQYTLKTCQVFIKQIVYFNCCLDLPCVRFLHPKTIFPSHLWMLRERERETQTLFILLFILRFYFLSIFDNTIRMLSIKNYYLIRGCFSGLIAQIATYISKQ